MRVRYVVPFDDAEPGEIMNLAPVIAEELIRRGIVELTDDALTPYSQRVRRG